MKKYLGQFTVQLNFSQNIPVIKIGIPGQGAHVLCHTQYTTFCSHAVHSHSPSQSQNSLQKVIQHQHVGKGTFVQYFTVHLPKDCNVLDYDLGMSYQKQFQAQMTNIMCPRYFCSLYSTLFTVSAARKVRHANLGTGCQKQFQAQMTNIRQYASGANFTVGKGTIPLNWPLSAFPHPNSRHSVAIHHRTHSTPMRATEQLSIHCQTLPLPALNTLCVEEHKLLST